MLFRILFYFIIFYFILKIVKWFINLNSNIKEFNNSQKTQKQNEKEGYSKKDIQDAEFEEIE
jgi:hypothetical protein